ncbi:Acyltransferase, partial [Cooperia oncophora]
TVFEYGDDVATYYRDQRVLLICNHQSTADVPTLMACLQSKGTLWLMDVMFRWSPFGIIGNNHGDYFIMQGKATREKEILSNNDSDLKKHLNEVFWDRDRRWVIVFPEGGFYYKRVESSQRLKKHLNEVFWDRDRRWVIVFPEGGFYYKRVESSQRYGKLNGFPHLKYTTLPRMGAVKAILEELGPRAEEADEPRERSFSKLKLITNAVGDIVGEIREKKYVKGTILTVYKEISYPEILEFS